MFGLAEFYCMQLCIACYMLCCLSFIHSFLTCAGGIRLRDKLKQLADQYTLAQQQYAQEVSYIALSWLMVGGHEVDNGDFIFFFSFHMLDALQLKQKTLELKIAELKIQQNEEKLAHEKEQMKLYAEKISQLLETEKSLRLQLTADGEKFQQFQVSIALLPFSTMHISVVSYLLSPGDE